MKKQLLSILLVIFMLVGIMPINAIATENYGEFIDGEHIISDMIAKNNKYAHPRIIMSNEKFAKLKRSIGDDSVTAGLLEKLRNKADEILDLPVSEYEIPDGIRLLETSKEIQRRVAALAMAYNIFEDGKYAQRCYEELVAACNFSDWNPSHFLDTAEMSTAFALGYDWLYHWMNDEQRAFLRKNMIEKGLMQVMEDYEDMPRTRTYRWYQDEEGDNWKLVCNGGMSLAALAIGDEDDAKDIAAKVLDYAYKDAYSFVRRAYSKKDGTYKEGLGYWDYATYYLGLYSSALKSTTGTDYGLAAHDGLRKSVDFIRYMSSNTSKSFSFGDDGDSRDTGWAVLLWLAEYYQSYDIAGPRMEKIPSDSFNYLDLLWIDEAKCTGSDEDSPTDWGAVGASNASFRNNWDKSGIVAALHAGINDYMYHGHYDLGSFYIESDGARFFTDLGNEQYELPNRQYSYRIRAEGHNTLVINPSEELDQQEGAECLITQFNGGNVAYAVTDLTDAYEPSGAESVVRGLKMIKDKECVVIQDEISLNAPGEIYWFAHTKGQIEVANDGKSAVVTVDSEKLWVGIISDDGNFTVMNAESLPTSPVVPNQTDNNNYKKLAIHLTNTKDTTISVACIPLKQGEVQPSWTPSMKAMSEWTPQTPENVSDVVAAPEADDTVFTYNGEEQTYTLAESDYYTITGNKQTNAGTYTVTVALKDKDNTVWSDDGTTDDKTYNFVINKATPPALTIPTATSITYGDTLSSSVLSDSSWAWVDGTIVPNASDYYNAYIEVDDNNYDYTGIDGYDDVNHRVVRGVDVIINRATLTITANSYTIKVGSALPTYEYTVTGLVGNDTLPIDVTISCNAADSNTVGIYPITISGVASDALASLYAPIYVNGELTITEKDIQEIAADDVTLTYGETKNIGATTNGNGTISYSTTSDVISVAADGTITARKAGTATVTITAAETADYAEATKTISVTVNKKKVAVPTADTTEYTYTGTAQTYGVTSTDDYTVEGGVQTNAGEYPITITLNNENYEWDGTLGTYKFVINKAAVTVTAKSYTIKVGEALPTYAYDVAGLVNGETLPIDVTISCNAADSNTAGTYDIIVSGAATSDNYTFAFVNGKLTVVETSAGGETGGESGGNEGGVGGNESIPAVTTPSTTPSYTGRPSWVTIPSETTTTTTTTTTQPPVDEDIDDDTDDEDIEIDEDTDTTKPVDDGDEPQIKGEDDKTGWDVIADEIADADDGDKIVVDMNGTTEVPENILEQIQGQDIDLVIELDNGFTWTINGESVTEPMDIDLGVNEGATIPVKVINEVTGECSYITITLTHNGEFGFTAVLTVDMGDENEGIYANLYWYTSGNTEFICADKINNKGKADLTFTHASEYIIVIDETNHGKQVEESDNADEDADSDVDNIFNREEDDDVNPFTAVTISFTGVIISAATIMIARKRKKQ